VAIILHSLCIGVEGSESEELFAALHTHSKEEEDGNFYGEHEEDIFAEEAGEQKRKQLVAKLLAFHSDRQLD